MVHIQLHFMQMVYNHTKVEFIKEDGSDVEELLIMLFY